MRPVVVHDVGGEPVQDAGHLRDRGLVVPDRLGHGTRPPQLAEPLKGLLRRDDPGCGTAGPRGPGEHGAEEGVRRAAGAGRHRLVRRGPRTIGCDEPAAQFLDGLTVQHERRRYRPTQGGIVRGVRAQDGDARVAVDDLARGALPDRAHVLVVLPALVRRLRAVPDRGQTGPEQAGRPDGQTGGDEHATSDHAHQGETESTLTAHRSPPAPAPRAPAANRSTA